MIYILLALVGVALGSFVNALVWRLHELEHTKGKKKRAELSITKGRSMCPDCKHTLAWYDLLPVLSWVLLRGKCRYCKKPIPRQYPLVELVVAISLPVSWRFWPYQLNAVTGYILFGFWAISFTLMVALFLYDLKWMILPDKLVYALLSSVFALKVMEYCVTRPKLTEYTLSSLLGMAVLGGFFWVMYQVSHGKWIGGGDVKLGFALGLLLGAQKALLCLVGAAYLATIVIIILVIIRKYHKKMKLPFGPFLIAAAYASLLWGQHLIDAYKRLSGL